MIQIYNPNTEYEQNGNMTLFQKNNCDLEWRVDGNDRYPIDLEGRWVYRRQCNDKMYHLMGTAQNVINKKKDSGVSADLMPGTFHADCFLLDIRPTDKNDLRMLWI